MVGRDAPEPIRSGRSCKTSHRAGCGQRTENPPDFIHGEHQRVLAVLDEVDPLPEDWPSPEESLAAFHKKYDYLFKELQAKVDQQMNRGEGH